MISRIKSPFRLLAALFVFAAWMTGNAGEPDSVKYVFLFIGDGLSMPQRMVTQEYLSRVEPGRELLINTLENQAVTTTRAADQFITDSAASGTAIACGSKTLVGRLGVDAEGNALESVAEVAKKNGRKVGIVTSVSLDHATPAAFYAHVANRASYKDIAKALVDSKFDYFGGACFLDEQGYTVGDKTVDVYTYAAENGYKVTRDIESFNELKAGETQPVICVAERVDSGSLPYAVDMNDRDITLAQFTQKAVDLLDNPNGFFIMVEGGKIDWACHANDAGTVLHEVIAFDDAVRVAYDFAQQHPDETLIVVTGDHETGGLTLGFAGTAYDSHIELLQNQVGSLNAFYAQYTKLRDEKGKDKITFDDVKPLITEFYGLNFTSDDPNDPMLLTDIEQATLEQAFDRSNGRGSYAGSEDARILYGGYDPLAMALNHMVANKASVSWSSYAHTALPVLTSAYGEEADEFTALIDNTDIAKTLKQIVGPVNE